MVSVSLKSSRGLKRCTVKDLAPMPAIFSSTYRLNPWINETTTTKAVTPTIMPRRVSADRSLWAQIAAIASLRVSMNFTALLRISPNYGFLFPAQGIDGVQSSGLPCGPQAENNPHCRRDPDTHRNGPKGNVGR